MKRAMILEPYSLLSPSRKKRKDSKTSPLANKLLKRTSGSLNTAFKSSSLFYASSSLDASSRNKKSPSFLDDTETLKKKAVSSLFLNKNFAVEFPTSCKYKEKQRIRRDITEHGGTIFHILTKKVTALIISHEECKTTYKCRKAQELSIPVIDIKYIEDSIKAGVAKDLDEYMVIGRSRTEQLKSGTISSKPGTTTKSASSSTNFLQTVDWRKFPCTEKDQSYLSKPDEYQVPKWAFLKAESNKPQLYVLEIHVIDSASNNVRLTVFSQLYHGDKLVKEELREVNETVQAEALFTSLLEHYTKIQKGDNSFKLLDSVPPNRGSIKLQQSLFSWTIDDVVLSRDVQQLIDMVWDEAVGQVKDTLGDINDISRGGVEEAEGLLLEMKRQLVSDHKDETKWQQMVDDYFNSLPFRERTSVNSLKDINKHLDVIQLLHDILSVGEITDWQLTVSTKNKMKALNCHISEYNSSLSDLGLSSPYLNGQSAKMECIYQINRQMELSPGDCEGTKLLFHASKPENYLGIMSRGLLLPKHVVGELGGQRTDAGNLGHGLYFGDEFRTSAEYTRKFSNHSRLMLVCEVFTGNSCTTTTKMEHLTEAPSGYDSVLGLGQTSEQASAFKSNEYCVYNKQQQRVKYIIQYTEACDESDRRNYILNRPMSMEADDPESSKSEVVPPLYTGGSSDMLADILPGLQVEGAEGDTPIPLQSINVMAKLVDLLAEVAIHQVYYNNSDKPIEAKFVFPLSEMAAVCGFEAFINDKHIIGKVKEKETARREYRRAVSEGHGAYLMTQDKERPEVFTISVGNLPPHTHVLIKITYVCELTVQEEKLVFELPTNIAPWNVKQALGANTQNTTKQVNIGNGALQTIKCGLDVVVQMPFDIRELTSPTHKVLIKRTATQAMVRIDEDQTLDKGFTLMVKLAEVHVPRMIIENHPDDPESMQACMLSFYPEFETEPQESYELIILLDLSNSMSYENVASAKKIAIDLLQCLNSKVFYNLITFGSTYSELFSLSLPAYTNNKTLAVNKIKNCESRRGNTDIVAIISNLSLLASPSRHRNVVLISDGHLTNSNLTLQTLSENSGRIRLFTLTVGSAGNKYLMREMARIGCGVSEYMNPKARFNWGKQLKGIIEKARQPLLSQVKVVWQEQNADLPQPLQAPACIPSLFSGNRIVVYGFASNCFMATLRAVIGGREVSTVVSASPLNASTGLTVHRLTARAVIQDWEHGCLSNDPVEHQIKKKNVKQSIIEMSKDYSIVSQFTSFVAIEERDTEEQKKPSHESSDILAKFNKYIAESMVDLLPGMEYEGTDTGLKKYMAVKEIQYLDNIEDVEEELDEQLCYDGMDELTVEGGIDRLSYDGIGSVSYDGIGSVSYDCIDDLGYDGMEELNEDGEEEDLYENPEVEELYCGAALFSSDEWGASSESDRGFGLSSPTSPAYSPTSPAYSPTSPAYSPASPAYSPMLDSSSLLGKKQKKKSTALPLSKNVTPIPEMKALSLPSAPPPLPPRPPPCQAPPLLSDALPFQAIKLATPASVAAPPLLASQPLTTLPQMAPDSLEGPSPLRQKAKFKNSVRRPPPASQEQPSSARLIDSVAAEVAPHANYFQPQCFNQAAAPLALSAKSSLPPPPLPGAAVSLSSAPPGAAKVILMADKAPELTVRKSAAAGLREKAADYELSSGAKTPIQAASESRRTRRAFREYSASADVGFSFGRNSALKERSAADEIRFAHHTDDAFWSAYGAGGPYGSAYGAGGPFGSAYDMAKIAFEGESVSLSARHSICRRRGGSHISVTSLKNRKEKLDDAKTTSTPVPISHGLYRAKEGKDLKTIMLYPISLTDGWKPELHVIGKDISKHDQRIDYLGDGADVIQNLVAQLKNKIRYFNSGALENCLIQAGVKSLGKVAATEILFLFLWRMAMFVALVEQFEQLEVAPPTPVEWLVERLDIKHQNSPLLSDMPGWFSSLPQTGSFSFWNLTKKHSMVLQTLSMGTRWSCVLMNMMCTKDLTLELR